MRPVCLNWDVQVERYIRQWYNIWDVDAASRRRTTYFDIKSVVFRVITRRRVKTQRTTDFNKMSAEA